jgi:lipopolysaccharide exporter
LIQKLKPKSEFGRNILKLANTSIIATLISLLSLPVITRIYDPSVFGEFQILLSTIGLLSVIGSFKYEMAIVLPKNKTEANAVYSLSILLLIISTTIFSFLFYFFGSWFLELINAQVLEPYLFMLVIGIFLSGAVQIARYVLTKEKNFHKLGNNRVIEAGTAQGLKIGIGLVSPTFLGLFISQLVGYILSLYLAMKKSTVSFSFSKKRVWTVFRKYKKFLYFNTPAVFVNTLALQLPIFFIAKYFGTEYVGYYMLALRLIEVPLKIIGNAISQVYYKEAADTYHKGIDKLLNLYVNTVKKLALFMIVPTALIYFISEPLIPYILGENWAMTGQVMSMLVLWKFFEMINYPISTTLTVIDQQHIDLFLKLFVSLGFRVFALLTFTSSFFEMMWALVISASFYYILFNSITYYRLRKLT